MIITYQLKKQRLKFSRCFFLIKGSKQIGSNDVMAGLAGYNNKIYGFDGNDALHGRNKDYRIDGGNGNDQLIGSGGNDHIIGVSGNGHALG